MATGFVFDEHFLLHDTGPSHPERPARLRAITDHLKKAGLWEKLTHLPVKPAPLAKIEAIQTPAYIRRLQAACIANEPYIDVPDSAICPGSYDIALLAAGGALAAVDAVMGTPDAHPGLRNAFCALRPPGHHAERDRSMGFCLFGNIAIAAQHLIDHHKLSRIAIVDFDVHHGNGTQHIFEERADVFFISLHEHPDFLYPGTGYAYEKGKGKGEGFTLNIPLQPRGGDDVYRTAFTETVLPALDKYKPEFLLVSAGFDASEKDPLAHMKVTTDGFAWMSKQLVAAAKKLCNGRLVSCLEGGYDPDALSAGVAAHITALLEG